MAQRESDPREPIMVSEAVTLIDHLFSEENRKLWGVCFPKRRGDQDPPTQSDSPLQSPPSTPRRSRAPPSSQLSYDWLPIPSLPNSQALLSAVNGLGEDTKKLFRHPFGAPLLHNSSFWTTFFNSLMLEMSGGLMVRPGYERTEADVRYQLISPLLKRVAHSMASLVPPASNEDQDDDPVYASSLTVEKATERRIHIPGAKPRVDYCFVGYHGDQILYTIAVETKKKVTSDNVKQLAHFMASLGGGGGKENVGIGILIDENIMRLAFAPLSLPDGESPLPIVLVSPSFSWRSGTFLNRGACIMICILQQMVLKRKTTTEEEMSCSMGADVWSTIRNTMVEILNNPPPSEHAVIPHDYSREIQTLKETVESLIDEVEMLKEDRDTSEGKGRKRFRLY